MERYRLCVGRDVTIALVSADHSSGGMFISKHPSGGWSPGKHDKEESSIIWCRAWDPEDVRCLQVWGINVSG